MVDGYPRTRIPAAGLDVEDAAGLAQRLVERGLARVVLPCGEDAVRDRAGDDGVSDAGPPKPSDVAVRVRRFLLRKRQSQLQDAEAGERRERRVGGEPRAGRQVRLDPAVRDDARVGLRQLARVADRLGQRHDQEEQRHRREPAQPAGQGAERR